ncbi:MAG TPA: MFS transporter [Clostridium sp.]|uniref:MFS transporter n=1 Tax=Clostridium sp. TaxID=1506 RepID=UPI002F957B59
MSTPIINKNIIPKKGKINYGWILVAVMLFGAIVNYLDRVNLSISGTTISTQFHLSPIQMGILFSAMLLPYAVANLPAGWITDKYGEKKLFTAATILWSIATIAAGFSQTFSSLYASRVLLGIAEAPFFICGAKITQKWFDDKNRGLATSVINMGPPIANTIAPPLLTFLLISFGWRIMFIGLGLTGFVVTFLWLIFYKEKSNSNIGIVDAKPSNNKEKVKISWTLLLKHPSTWAMMVGNFGLIYVFWIYLTWIPTYLKTARGFSLSKTGWLAAIPFLAGIVGVPLGGYLSDYLIKKKGFNPIKARKTIIIFAVLAASIVIAPVAYVNSGSLSVVLLTAGFLFSSMPNGVVWTLATDVAPAKLVGSLGAIQNFAGYLGGSIAPILTGIIVSKTGSFKLVFVLSSMMLIMSAITYGVFLKDKIEIKDKFETIS